MDTLDLARLQFAVTTVYHFIFVPITIGLSALVAALQTAWVRTGKPEYLRATKFWGKLFLINFALGIVTGIVQEFQFGMNWSSYSRFVGDVFGPPLAIEGLLAFFLESTFLGLWIFGWDRLPKRLHLATIWIASLGTVLSAYFILAANSWMQHPVGHVVNSDTGRAELKDIWAVLTSDLTVITFAHTLAASLCTAAALMLAVAAWHLRRHNQTEVFRPSFRLGAWVLLISGLAVVLSGDLMGRLLTTQQPMKMAAAEALYETTEQAPFSVLTITSADGHEEIFSVRIPGLLSLLATGSPNGTVEGVNDLQHQAEERFGPGEYRPYVPAVFWSFRIMFGLGLLVTGIGALALWLTRKGRTPSRPWVWKLMLAVVAFPLLANTFGWLLTELGRQPWTVFGIFTTADSVSPATGLGEVATSLIVFTLLYGVLALIEVALLVRFARAGAPELSGPDDEGPGDDDSESTAFAY